MSSFVVVELRTSPPNLTVIVPAYTICSIPTYIEVRSDYELSQGYQDIYMTNSAGERIELILNSSLFRYTGYHVFNEAKTDIYTVHARLKDKVDNLSDEVTKSFILLEASSVKTSVETSFKSVVSDHKTLANVKQEVRLKKIKSSALSRSVNDSFSTQEIELLDIEKNIDLNDEERKVKVLWQL